MNTSTLAAHRIQRFLEREPIVWLSTVRPDGTPHIVPVWFWWDGEALLVFSKPDAQKVRNMRADPRVMLGIGDADEDFDIGLFEGRAEMVARTAAEVAPTALFDKYATQMRGIALSVSDYLATYSQVIRIVPVHYLGWHGRTMPDSVRRAGAPRVSLAEPRAAAIDETGEPVSARPPQDEAERPTPWLDGGWPGILGWLGAPLGRGLRSLGVGLPRPTGAGAL